MLTDSTVPIQPGEGPDPIRLQAYLQAPVGTILNISRFPGGYSNLTYCLHTAAGDFVLRRPPAGANIQSAHDMGREFRVLTLLKPHYTLVPEPVLYCDDPEVIGAPFFVMRRLDGVILRAHDTPGLNLAPTLLRQIGEALVDNLAALHALEIQATGLVQLGKPEGYVQRQVTGWIKRYADAATDSIPAMEWITNWLPEHLPGPQTPALLHNDYKHDNLVLDPANLTRILGVLDWEMATVGDPLMDLGATLAYWMEAEDNETSRRYNMTWLPGNLTRQEVVARYAAASGRDVSDILFYYVFGLFKNAAIAQQIYVRWKRGLTRDARFGMLLPMIVELAEKAEKAVAGKQV
jgi:aminoglycoside phosphotransferase (APT) family kinase protein